MPRRNIGILFMGSLLVAEFHDGAEVGGTGVYSPIGDGTSYSALWSSTRMMGALGSGIVVKSNGSDGKRSILPAIHQKEMGEIE